jgi:hypothetical protein
MPPLTLYDTCSAGCLDAISDLGDLVADHLDLVDHTFDFVVGCFDLLHGVNHFGNGLNLLNGRKGFCCHTNRSPDARNEGCDHGDDGRNFLNNLDNFLGNLGNLLESLLELLFVDFDVIIHNNFLFMESTKSWISTVYVGAAQR